MRVAKYLQDVVTRRNVDKYRRKFKNPVKTCHLQSLAVEKLEYFLRQVLEEAVRRVDSDRVLVKEEYIHEALKLYFLKNGSIFVDRERCRASSAPPP